MTEKRPLSWKKIFLCAVPAGPIALGLTFLVLEAMDGAADPTAGLIEVLLWLAMAMVAYLPITAVIAFVLSLLVVGYRRLAHTVLATLLSVPIALAMLWIIGIVTGS